jgi:dihydrodipicolinate synthase/N-acetylneuraminate lyase
MTYKKLQGVIAATVTPMDRGGEVNYEALAQMNQFLIAKGIHGIFPCGSTGEGVLLTAAERKRIAEGSVRDGAGRVPVVIHTGSLDLKEALDLTAHAREIGADGAALIPPYYYSVDDAAILKFYQTVAEKFRDFPLYVYNIPPNVKNVVSPGVLSRLHAQYPHIVGVKDSSGDFMNFIGFKQAMPADFCILMGNDAQIYASLMMGGSGAVAATSAAFPEPAVEIYQAYRAGDPERALKAQNSVIKLRTLLRSYPPVASYKKVLEWRGIAAGEPRPPLRPMTPEECRKFRGELEGLGLSFP